jgi:hypothetical protein
MTDDTPHAAPSLGDATDASIGDDTAALLLSGAERDGDVTSPATEHEKTEDTPDELGGTGADEGGAG